MRERGVLADTREVLAEEAAEDMAAGVITSMQPGGNESELRRYLTNLT